MKTNESTIDRGIRVVLGLVLLALGFSGTVTGTLAIVFYVVGVVALATGLIGFCPLYAVLKIKSNN